MIRGGRWAIYFKNCTWLGSFHADENMMREIGQITN